MKISQCGQSYSFDALVIGSGIAGLCYILELLKKMPQIKIALITKGKLIQSNSYYAQGGMAATHTSEQLGEHVHDTLKAGDGLCHPATVQDILKRGQESIEYLLNHGVPFDRDAENNLEFAKEAGHSAPRIYHIGDKTGAGIIDSLLRQLKKFPNVTIFENHIAVNLITKTLPHTPQSFPEVIGAYVLSETCDKIHTMLANVTVLATGGAGKVFRYTTNPEFATGDGVAMAYRAGARVGGLEFYQFHPTLFYHSKINNFLISEALRGEGAYLRSPETGERFMQHYAPKEMELATRDVVARAIFSEIEKSHFNFVYLDIRHKDKKFLEKRFPTIYHTLATIGLDLSSDLIPVVPAAHYMGGGILTDNSGRTDLQRLFAIGETAFTGLHGANRLASNSLLEGVVMGRLAVTASMPDIKKPIAIAKNPLWDSTCVVDLRRASQINVHWRGLRGEMSSYAGIIRTENGLNDQLKLILTRKEMVEEYYWHYAITRDLIELRNIILVAELIVRFALKRRESRGGHFREDFSEKSNDMEESIAKINDFHRI
jgi:L-aspartate oxidase